jgi:hypothetical protein
MREPDRHTDTQRRPKDAAERMRDRDEPGRNFEQEVSDSDVNDDPDAGFDFDRNPTDEQEPKRSER